MLVVVIVTYLCMYVLSKISLKKKQTENWAITKDKRRINTDTAQI